MKHKTIDLILVILFMLFLICMGIGTLMNRDLVFSSKEKRYLEKEPVLSIHSLMNGDFGNDAENWAADHLPGRDILVGVNAQAERMLNLQVSKEIYLGKSGRLYERPVCFDEKVIRKNMDYFCQFTDKNDIPVDLILVPSAGFLMQDDIRGLMDPYEDDRIIQTAYEIAGDRLHTLNLLPVFCREDAEEFYYRTDHHWTSRGAYEAFALFMTMLEEECLREQDYIVSKSEGFYGTTWSRACFWRIPPETLEMWDSGFHFSVRFSDKEDLASSLFFTEHLWEYDQYPVFLDGNHPLLEICNHEKPFGEKILVIRDSFANCFGCFLADSFSTVTMVDLRYYRSPLSELVKQERYDRILILYSVNNFMTDSNIAWLE